MLTNQCQAQISFSEGLIIKILTLNTKIMFEIELYFIVNKEKKREKCNSVFEICMEKKNWVTLWSDILSHFKTESEASYWLIVKMKLSCCLHAPNFFANFQWIYT